MDERKAKIVNALDAARAELLAVLDGLGDGDWQRPTACQGWSIKDVVAHLAIGDAGNMVIVRRILNGEEGAVAGFDVDRYNQRQVEKRRDRSPRELHGDLAAGRRELVALLDELSDEQLSVAGHRTTGEPTTVEGVFYRLVEHDRMHAQHIRDALA